MYMNTTVKLFFTLFLALCSLSLAAQVDKKYLAGAVPIENGVVQFEKTYEVPHKSKAEIFQLLLDYTQHQIIQQNSAGTQSRLVENTEEEGLIAANVEEFMYFKQSALVSHGTRFFYQLIFEVTDNAFTAKMRRIYYLYDGMDGTSAQVQSLRAENWIVDEKALSKRGTKLAKLAGKFRKATIDRKNDIFREAATAAGAKLKVKVVKVEEVEE